MTADVIYDCRWFAVLESKRVRYVTRSSWRAKAWAATYKLAHPDSYPVAVVYPRAVT